MTKLQVITGLGKLMWVNITGDGKTDLNGNQKYEANVILEGEAAQEFKDTLDAFWEENKPKKIKNAKSFGYKPAKDANGNEIEGAIMVTFKSNVEGKNGKFKIKVYDADGNYNPAFDKSIGNGSIGAISGTAAIYELNAAQGGVTLYLGAVQVSELEEYSQDAGFGATGGSFKASKFGDDEPADTEEKPKPKGL